VLDFRNIVDEFIREPDTKTLFIYDAGNDVITCSLDIPDSIFKKKAVFFLKSKNIIDQLKVDDLQTDVTCAEVSESTLQNLSLLSQEVFFPLLSNPANRSGWSGPTSKEVMLKFSNFLANLTMTVGQSKVSNKSIL
jgi:hypothetical protein